MDVIYFLNFFPKNNNNIMVEYVNGRDDDVRVEIFTNNWKQSNRVT